MLTRNVRKLFIGVATAALCAAASENLIDAADGTWINTTPGAVTWSNPANWTGGTIADGAGSTANFNTVNTTGDITINLDAPRTLGTLIFGDTDPASAASWIIGGTNALTLDNTGGTGGPTITVNTLGTGKSTAINAPLNGAAGFTKNGAGTLVIGAAYSNTFAGTTILDGGTLTYAADNANVKGIQFGTAPVAGVGSTNSTALAVNANVTSTAAPGLVVQSNSTNTMNIAAGKTLTIAGGITIGFDAISAATAPTARLNVTGNSLVVNAGSQNLVVGVRGGTSAIDNAVLDLSGLSNFQFTGGEVRIAGSNSASTGDRTTGILTLAGTSNTITATSLTVAGGAGNSAAGAPQGTLNFGAGSNVINVDNFNVGIWRNTGIVQFAGPTGTLQIRGTAGGTSRSNLNFGNDPANGTSTSGTPVGTVTLDGHAVDILASTITLGSRERQSGGGATGVLSFNNGTIDTTSLVIAHRDLQNTSGTIAGTLTVGGSATSTATFKVGTGGFSLANNNQTNGASNGTLNINIGGTVQTNSDILLGAAVGPQNGIINLQGGTLDLLDTNATTHHNIGTDVLPITINAISGTLKDAGLINVSGGITKSGTTANSLLTIAGVNTYTGDTTINVGTVAVTGSLPAAGTVTVNGTSAALPGTLSGTGSVGAVTINNSFGNLRPGTGSNDGQIGTLTMASLTNNGGDMRFDLTSPAGTNDKVIVTGAASLNGATVSVAGTPLAGSYTLLTAGSLTGSAPTLNAPSGTRSTFSDSIVGNNLMLTVVGNSKSLTWTGGAATNGDTWDVNTTQNWSDNGGVATNEKFFNLDTVTFGNGPANRTVNIASTVTPASVTVNNDASNPYTFTGAGDISGANTTLVKSGAGTLTVANNNTYAGITTINAGTLQIGNGATSGSLGPGDVVDNGALAFNRSDAVNFGAVISGSGQVQQIGTSASTLTLSAANTYTGATTVGSGTLIVTTSASLGATSGPTIGPVNVAAGAALDLSGNTAGDLNFGQKQFTIAGDGVAAGGAIVNPSTGVAQQNVFQKLALSADATVSTGQRFDVRAAQVGGANSATLDLSGHKLTKIGGNTLGLVNATVTDGDILVTSGALSVEGSSVIQGNGAIRFDSTTNPVRGQFSQTVGTNITRPIFITGDNVTLGSNSNNPTAINSSISLLGNLTVSALNTNGTGTFTIAGNINDGALQHSVTKTNNGTGVSTLVLSGSNSFTGGLKIVGGVVQMGSSTALNSGIPVSFDDTATNTTGLRLAGNNVTFGGLVANSQPFVENGSATPATLTVNTSGPNTFFGTLQDGTGGGALSLAMGSGNLTLSSTNTYTGTTSVTGGGTLNITGTLTSSNFNIQNGTLIAGNGSSIPMNSGVSLGAGTTSGVLDLNGSNLTLTALSSSGTGTGDNVINSAGSAATLNFVGPNSTFGGKLQNNVQLVVGDNTNVSKLTLTGASTNTGGVTVNNLSTLTVNGSLAASAPIQINGGGVLTGTGSMGNLTLQIGSIIRPGNSGVGTLTAASLTATGSEYQPDLAAGNQSDKIAVTGAANIGGNVIITPTSPSPPAGTYTLLTSSLLGGTAPTLNVPTGTRQTFALHFGDTVPNAITLNVTGSNKSLTWTGAANSTWDLNTSQNWSDNGGTTTNEKFFQLDAVTFGNGPTNRNIALNFAASPASITVNNSTGNDYSIGGSGKITGVGKLTKSGTGKLTLTANNDYTGGTEINGGTLQVGDPTVGGGTSGAIGSGAVFGTGGNLVFARTDSVTVNAPLNGTINVSQIGGGALTLNATNAYSGTTIIGSGTVRLGVAGALPTGTSVTLGDAANHNGNLDLNGQSATISGLSTVGTGTANTITNSGAVDSTLTYAGGNSTFSGSIQDAGGTKVNLTVNSGTLQLTGTNTYSGATTTNGTGTLQIGNGGTSGTIGTGSITTNGTLSINHGDAVTISSVIGGTGQVRQDGSGTTTLSGVNTYSGATTIANGTVLINSGSSLGANTGTVGSVTINISATLDLSGETTGTLTFNAKPFFIAGSGVGGIGAIYNNGPLAQSTNGALEIVTLTADATINATQRLDLRGGTPFLDLAGHTLTVIGGSQFSFFSGTITPGTIDVQAGTFSIQQGASADGNGQVILENNSRMAFNNATTSFARPIKGNGNVTLFNSTTSSTVASPVSLNGSLSFAGSTAGTVLTLQGNISETTRSSVTVNNTNTPTPTVVLAGNNSYTGGTTITVGILQAGSDTALGAGQGPLIMNGTSTTSGTLDLNGHNVTTGSLGGGTDPNNFGTITNTAAGPATLTMNGTAAPPAFAGVIQNGTATVSLVKGGSGTSILSGANTYTGATTVKQGILAAGAANAIASASNLILSGGTFSTDGFNQSLGTVQLTATSGIDLGTATSKLNLASSGGVSWTPGAVLRIYDWDGTQAGGGTDQLVVGSSNSGLTAAQLSQIRFVGHATGASILPSGEIVPASAAIVASPGDFTRDGHVNGADVTAMLTALSDLNAFKTANSLTNDTFLDIGDLNGDLVVGNSDLQSLLTLLNTGHGSGAGSGAAAVPEPAGLTLGMAGAIVLLALLPRRRRVFAAAALR